MKIKTLKLKDLTPAEYNPRTITENGLAGLGNCQAKFGDISGIVFNARSQRLVCGHQRVKNLKGSEIFVDKVEDDPTGTIALGHIITADKRRFSFRVVDWNNITEKAAMVSANAETISGDWELEGLESMLEELKFELPEFDEINLDDLAASLDIDLDSAKESENKEADNVPEIEKEPVTKPGDLIELGGHRLLCGDSTKAADVERLMGKEKAELLFTSPPYSDMRDYENKIDLSIKHLINFIPTFYPFAEYQVINLGLQRKDHEIVEYWQNYILKAKECGYKFLSWNVWDKTMGGSVASATAMFVMTHEWLLVFGKKFKKLNRTILNQLDKYEARHGENWLNGSNRQVRQANGEMQTTTTCSYTHHQLHTVIQQTPELGHIREKHPATYPVKLPEKYIEAMTRKNQIIIEPFLGSGSTLIAAEKTNRRCFGMEIDPGYCQVSVQRWVDFTENTEVSINGKIVDWREFVEA